jgi:hypothetical protein
MQLFLIPNQSIAGMTHITYIIVHLGERKQLEKTMQDRLAFVAPASVGGHSGPTPFLCIAEHDVIGRISRCVWIVTVGRSHVLSSVVLALLPEAIQTRQEPPMDL